MQAGRGEGSTAQTTPMSNGRGLIGGLFGNDCYFYRFGEETSSISYPCFWRTIRRMMGIERGHIALKKIDARNDSGFFHRVNHLPSASGDRAWRSDGFVSLSSHPADLGELA